MSVSLRREGPLALIEIDNPPVNALSHAVRQGLMDAIGEAAATDAGAVVITGKGRAFSGGADIREFGQPPLGPGLPEVIDAVEACAKPVVAAIRGVALGGGCELALGCHYRVAAPDARIGLPEVRLGLIPGAGGTQRLPRLVGATGALAMIASGEPLTAQDALRVGLIDAIEDGSLPDAARAFAGRPVRRVSEAPPPKLGPDFAAAEARTLKRARGLRAPAACIEAVRLAASLSFAEGMARERALFTELRDGDESKAQRHLFFAERAALKVPGVPKATPARAVERTAILGAGTMGTGIALAFAQSGLPVVLIDPDPAALEAGMARLAAKPRAARITAAADLAPVAEADLVIEAVPEEIDLKQEVFAELGRRAPPDAVLATNTSSLDVDAIAAASGRPEVVVGMHFFSPAHVMRLLEVVRGAATSPGTLRTAIETGRRLGKVPVTVGNCFGFAGNRMLYRRLGEVERLLLAGAAPAEIDAAARTFGFAMGPCEVGDMAGLDIGWKARKAAGRAAPVTDAICEAGRFGQKTGAGYYRYEAGSRTPIPDPHVDGLIDGIAKARGIARRPVPPEEIADHLTLPLIDEGARILAEGIAARPGDIDLVWVHGYGWPVATGGPMHHAARLGPAHIAERLEKMAEAAGDPTLRPAPPLARLAAGDRGFDDLAGG